MVNANDSVKGERYAFSTDIKKLMGLIINTFYSNKDVFLRELISNASDAIDKIKFQSLTDASVLGDETKFKIEIVPNKEAKTITIRDNGIGMTKQDMIQNLGSIATSGTKSFMDAIKAGADIQMIGQFGVGFYSSFLVSDQVLVRSKHRDDTQHVWQSDASGEFEVLDDSKNENQLKRGTEIVLHLKDGEEQYLEERRIKEIIKKHSEFVGPEILLWVTKEIEKEVTDDEAEEDEKTEETKDEKAEEMKDEKAEETKDEKAEEMKDEKAEEMKDEKAEEMKDEETKESDVKIEEVKEDEEGEAKKEKKTKKVTEIEEKFEQINQSKPLWAMKPEDVKPEDYNSLYKSTFNDWEDPLAYKHFHVEGQVEFTGLVFIPKRPPFDLFNSQKRTDNVKLYVRRVFINDDSKELCPEYLGFVRGIIDSDEMPLNISRETLQKNKIMKVIKNNLVKKTLELIGEIAEDSEKFETFYKSFSKNLKYGVHEDSANRAKLAEFLRFASTKGEAPAPKEDATKAEKKAAKTSLAGMRSLRDYVEAMPEHQKDIYYISGETPEATMKLPFLEQLRTKDLEVLLMTDPIDEYFVQQMSEFEGHKLVSVTKEGLELPQSEEEKAAFEKQKKELEPFCKRAKEVLGSRVEKVEVSSRMTRSPCYISTGRYGWSSRMEQIMKNQALRETSYNMHMAAKKILEVNPNNAVVREVARRLEEDANDAVAKNLVFLLFDTAVLTSGGLSLSDPAEYAERIYKLTRLGLNIADEEDADEDMPALAPAEDGAEKPVGEMEQVD